MSKGMFKADGKEEELKYYADVFVGQVSLPDTGLRREMINPHSGRLQNGWVGVPLILAH